MRFCLVPLCSLIIFHRPINLTWPIEQQKMILLMSSVPMHWLVEGAFPPPHKRLITRSTFADHESYCKLDAVYTLQETNIFYRAKRKIMYTSALVRDMLVCWRVPSREENCPQDPSPLPALKQLFSPSWFRSYSVEGGLNNLEEACANSFWEDVVLKGTYSDRENLPDTRNHWDWLDILVGYLIHRCPQAVSNIRQVGPFEVKFSSDLLFEFSTCSRDGMLCRKLSRAEKSPTKDTHTHTQFNPPFGLHNPFLGLEKMGILP